jgi:Cu(I)/Ag(I) efflux system membrane protein CusA/SilA
MKPLATPVLGGMVSSLAHVLIVTPVLFLSIRERQLGLHEELPVRERPSGAPVWIGVALATLVLVAAFTVWRLAVNAPEDIDAGSRVVQTVRSGSMDVVILSPTGALRTGRNTFTIEFRSPTGSLVDVGDVRVGANMTMPGMVMSSNAQVHPGDAPGRFAVTAEFGMAGAWPINVEWNGPAGKGSTTLEGSVQ